jgi:hypothetical protein
MVVADDVDIQVGATKLHGASQAFALDMEGARGVRWKAALVVLKDKLVCASPMGVDAVVSTRNVPRVHKGAPYFARHMVVESVAYLQGAPKVRKGARHCARGMVGESAAYLMVVEFAQRVSMGARTSVLPMVVERDVLFQAAQRAHVAAQIVVLGMGEGRGASLKTVGRVHKGAQISARRMVGESDAPGERENARNLLGVRVVFVLLTVAWCRSGRQTREV